MPRSRSLERPSGNSTIPAFCKTKTSRALHKTEKERKTTQSVKVRKSSTNTTNTNKKRKTISGDSSINKKQFTKSYSESNPIKINMETIPNTTTSCTVTSITTTTSIPRSPTTDSTKTTTTTTPISVTVMVPTPQINLGPNPNPANPLPNPMNPQAVNLQLCDEERLFSRLEERLEVKLSSSLKIGFQEYDNSFCTAVNKMTTAVNELVKSNQALVAQQTSIGNLEIENKVLSNKVHRLEVEQHKLKNKIDNIENRSLSNCILIKGVPDEMDEDIGSLTEKVYYELSKTIDARTDKERRKLAREMVIVKCKRIGRYRRTWSRPISIEFQYNQDLEYIMSNRRYLRHGIFIDKEYNEETERKRRLLRPILRAARNISEYQSNCRIEDDKLWINGKSYTAETLDQLPPDLNAFTVTSVSNSECIGFFGELNPLSNFHPAKFICDGITFHSSEQYIQWKKAELFNDTHTANSILSTSTTLECKNLSTTIKNFNKPKWESCAKSICSPGIYCKFAQNPALKDLLINCTGNRKIVECAKDRFWGTGVALHRDDALDSTMWTTPGILGSILMEIREQLRTTPVLTPVTDDNMETN